MKNQIDCIPYLKLNNQKKGVLIYDLNHNLIKKTNSLKEASIFLNRSSSTVYLNLTSLKNKVIAEKYYIKYSNSFVQEDREKIILLSTKKNEIILLHEKRAKKKREILYKKTLSLYKLISRNYICNLTKLFDYNNSWRNISFIRSFIEDYFIKNRDRRIFLKIYFYLRQIKKVYPNKILTIEEFETYIEESLDFSLQKTKKIKVQKTKKIKIITIINPKYKEYSVAVEEYKKALPYVPINKYLNY